MKKNRKTKKNNESNVQTKPVLKDIFKKRLLIAFLIATAIISLGYYVAVIIYRRHVLDYAIQFTDHTCEDLESQFQERMNPYRDYFFDKSEKFYSDENYKEIRAEIRKYCDDISFQMALKNKEMLWRGNGIIFNGSIYNENTDDLYFGFRAMGYVIYNDDDDENAETGLYGREGSKKDGSLGEYLTFGDSVAHENEKYIEIYEPDKTRTYYRLPSEIADEVEIVFTEYEKLTDGFSADSGDGITYKGSTYRILMEAYIDGIDLYPRFTLVKQDGTEWIYDDSDEEWETVKISDFFPENVDGMRYVNGGIDSAISVGSMAFNEEKEIASYVDSRVKEYMSERYHGLWSSREDEISGKIDNGILYLEKHLFPHFDRYIFMSIGNSVNLVFAFPCSLIRRYPVQVVAAIVLVFVLAGLAAYILAKMTFAERLSRYLAFASRQETTRAIAHDLKTPLTSLAGYAELLQEDTEPEKKQHYIEMIPKNVEQMNRIISDLLELSKTGINTLNLTKEKINLDELCKEIIESTKGTFESAGLTCKFTSDAKSNITANRRLLEQAVSNLVQNAAVHSKRGTDVNVSITNSILTNGCELCIDNIPAVMPKMSAEELVKPFVKGEDSRGEKNGSGVGLAVAKHNMEMMGFIFKVEIDKEKFTVKCFM